jgi:hypothetical protein
MTYFLSARLEPVATRELNEDLNLKRIAGYEQKRKPEG